MPNWCTNTLEVTGTETDVNNFRLRAHGRQASYHNFYMNGNEDSWEAFDDIRKRALTQTPAPLCGPEMEFCFNALYPVPDEFRRFAFDDNSARKMGEEVGEERPYGGYSWQTNHWGTKWDIGNVYVEHHPQWWRAEFDTAWSPPLSFVEKISADFPTLLFSITYYEGGMGFAGKAEFQNGECISDEELPIEDFIEDWDDDDEE